MAWWGKMAVSGKKEKSEFTDARPPEKTHSTATADPTKKRTKYRHLGHGVSTHQVLCTENTM
jgi:hypothetical protein